MKKKAIISVAFLLIASQIFAITWDEPWRKEILQKAEYFVLGKVINSTDSIITIRIQKAFGDSTINGEIKIDNFFLLDLCSRSGGHGPEFNFEKNEEGYFFLKKGENGNYQLPTPTSGVDRIVGNKRDKRDKRKIWKLRKKVSNENEGFGGNLMDPRICTYFPSPKQAIIDLNKTE